jgi:hypothetical protein
MIMSERKTDSSTRGGDTSPADGRGRADGADRHERDKDEFESGTGYQPNTNQAQDEPLPASHHDDGRQETAQPREPVRDDPSPRGQDQEE